MPMPKMWFTYVLSSVLALSTVFGTPSQLTYETEELIQFQKDEKALIVGINDRPSNLKYVMAIQSSSIWMEIKKRSLTINTPPLAQDLVKKPPTNLSDQELVQLKQVCHDGLKCVAVDQLLLLQQVVQPMDGGRVSVRRTITKITQVITQYTAEYHEDIYKYVAVQQSDDPSKVSQLVTTIVEDNKELCRIGVTNPKNEGRSDYSDSAKVAKKGTVNYNMVENYNINNGTVNDATVIMNPSDGVVMTLSPEPETAAATNDTLDTDLVIVVAPQTTTDSLTDKKSVTEVPQNRFWDKSARKHRKTDSIDRRPSHASTGNRVKPKLIIIDGPPNEGASSDRADIGTGQDSKQNVHGSRPDSTTGHSDDDIERHVLSHPRVRKPRSSDNHSSDQHPSDQHSSDQHSSDQHDNKVMVMNGGGGSNAGKSDSDADIVSSGSFNDGAVKKGYVSDGMFNNGNMIVSADNRATTNTGKLSDSNAGNGIINVGTVNNGPVNYGKSNKYTNNATQATKNSYDVQQYLASIDQMYSTILQRLA